ncbi:MAG: class I SAM-dependent methyltransferase [Actinomycetota bacterium]|nr:class I SAM-dependent methyltransferase [Actinomycetota bacterium]
MPGVTTALPSTATLPPVDRCPICAGPLGGLAARSIDRLVTGDGPFDVHECPRCELGVTRPRLTDEELGRYYSSDYYEAFCEWAAPRRVSPLRRARRRWRAFAAGRRTARPPFSLLIGTGQGRVLDVGCGDGGLLAQFADAGWDAVGLDPSETAIAAVRARGLEAHAGTLGHHPWPPGSFDAVLFSHSLEHIPDPMAALEEAARLLAPGGALAVVVPNWKTWQRRLFGGRWFSLDLPRHQQHFSPTALRRAAERVGLAPIAVDTESNIISPAYSIHYLIAGRWTEGWKLWVAYGLALALFPLFALMDRRRGGDGCYLVARRPPAAA